MRAVTVSVHYPIRLDRSAHVGGFVTTASAAQPDGEETALVTQTASATLAAALEEFPRVCVGSRGKPTDVLQVRFTDTIVALGGEIRPSDRMFFGQSWACGFWICPPSQINYDLHLTSAQIFAQSLQITSQDEILRAAGRGIGNTAAHEFGHRRNVAGMDREGDQWFTDGGADRVMFTARH